MPLVQRAVVVAALGRLHATGTAVGAATLVDGRERRGQEGGGAVDSPSRSGRAVGSVFGGDRGGGFGDRGGRGGGAMMRGRGGDRPRPY